MQIMNRLDTAKSDDRFCSWCGTKIEPNEDQIILVKGRRLLSFHFSCYDGYVTWKTPFDLMMEANKEGIVGGVIGRV